MCSNAGCVADLRRLFVRRLLVVALTALCAVPAAGAHAAAPAAVPQRIAPQATVIAGFTDSLVTNGVSAPTALAPLPDGRVLVLQKTGAVRVLKGGALLGGTALTLTVCSQSERGLLGVAVDPEFGNNGLLFLYYTRPSAGAPGGCVNRVSRFLMNGDSIDAASETVLLDNIPSPAGNHNGGDLEVGNDGFLYVSVGDGGTDPRGRSGANKAAQDLSLLNGKILRIDRSSGAPATGNPFSGAGTEACATRGGTAATPPTTCQEIFAYGLRNPWRFAFDQNTGATRFFINDVGQNTREEVDLGIKGANYGWPAREGQCAQGENPVCAPPDASLGYTQPLTDYPHNPTGEYITGGAFIPNGAWGGSYDGGYLFADGNPGKIFFRNAAGSAVNYNTPLVTGVGGISDIGFVMETAGWALYTVNAGTSEVRKVVYNTAAAVDPGPLAYSAVTTAQRPFDSRNAGTGTGPLRGGTSRLVNLVAAQGVHRAALVNITMAATSDGFVVAWQPRTTRPASSNVNGQRGVAVANSSVVPIDADGNVLVYSSVTADVIIDVVGFFDTAPGGVATAGRFTPVTPGRAADSRSPGSATNAYTRAASGADSVVTVPIAGRFGVTPDVSAVAVIVTAIGLDSDVGGFVVVYPRGGAVPPSSNVNTGGLTDTRANLVVVPLGTDGSIDVRLTRMSHVIVDVVGTFTSVGAPSSSAGTYNLLTATRVVDTRSSVPFGRMVAGGTGAVNPATVPDNALGVTQNIIMVEADGWGYVTAFPTGLASLPVVSNGNVVAAGQTRSAMSLTVLGGGSSSYYVSIGAHLVVDVTGYFSG
jgi:glucose/arabinose dehydrogenase